MTGAQTIPFNFSPILGQITHEKKGWGPMRRHVDKLQHNLQVGKHIPTTEMLLLLLMVMIKFRVETIEIERTINAIAVHVKTIGRAHFAKCNPENNAKLFFGK